MHVDQTWQKRWKALDEDRWKREEEIHVVAERPMQEEERVVCEKEVHVQQTMVTMSVVKAQPLQRRA